MLTEDPKDNTVVILSDDDEDDEQVINENRKRPRLFNEESTKRRIEYEYDSDMEQDYEQEEFDNEEEEEYEDYADMICKNQTLPEDHESVIFSERNQPNPLKELNDIFTEFKAECVQGGGMEEDDIETSFACGWPLKDNAPDIAMNVEGVVGPITFPLSPKDAHRIIQSRPRRDTCFELDASQIVLNLSFQEYLFDTILSDVVSYLGVDAQVAKQSSLVLNKFNICEKDKQVNLPDSLPKGAYGTVIIILLSDFSGGDVLTNYQDYDIMFQPETDTLSECYYMAWYNDVSCKFQPIVSGHQASITFSLVYTGDETIHAESLQQRRLATEEGNLTPTQLDKSKSCLQKAVDYFKSDAVCHSKYPYFYMLNYSYTSSSICIDDLKRSDKLLAKAFLQVAEEAGYHMYLGSVGREVEAKVTEDAAGEILAEKKSDEKDNGCAIDEEGIYLTQSMVYDEFILTTLNDAQGKNVLPNPVAMDSKEHQPVIQGTSWYSRCKPDSEDYSGIKNVKDVTVKYWYSNNSALVFIPKTNLSDLIEMSKESDY